MSLRITRNHSPHAPRLDAPALLRRKPCCASAISRISPMRRRSSRISSPARARAGLRSGSGREVEIQWFVYNAGPSAMEAIFADSHRPHLRRARARCSMPTRNRRARKCASSPARRRRRGAGGAAGRAASAKPADFQGKKIATPQLGNTQDVACRAWLKKQGFQITQTRRRRVGAADGESRPARALPTQGNRRRVDGRAVGLAPRDWRRRARFSSSKRTPSPRSCVAA